MLLERHYDDEALISLLESDRVDSDTHLPACRACSSKLESYRDLSSVLREAEVWDTREWSTEPSASSISRIRAFATQMEDEDAQAEGYVAQLLAGPREEWMPRLQQHPEWRTAGVVRKLIAGHRGVMMKMPPDSLEMTALSTEIADHLCAEPHQGSAMASLRASAWREYAFALFYVGRFGDSLAACDVAERCLEAAFVDDYEGARIGIVRSLDLRAMENLVDAVTVVRNSREVFDRYDDVTRLASALMAETHLMFSRGEFSEARVILESLEKRVRGGSDADTHARVLGNLGYAYWKLNRIDDALGQYEASATLLDGLGVRTEAVRVRWGVAAVLASAGRTDEALARYRVIQQEFAELGMTSEWTVNGLEMAEILLARNEFAAVEEISRAAMRALENSGIPYGTRALTAIAYIQEAARTRTATPGLVKHVRDYIRRLPREGELLFAPPPL